MLAAQGNALYNDGKFILETTSRAASSVKNDQEPIDWDEEWRKSAEADKVVKEIDRYAAIGLENSPTREPRVESFSASTFLQCQLLTKRTFVKYWKCFSMYFSYATSFSAMSSLDLMGKAMPQQVWLLVMVRMKCSPPMPAT